MLKPKFCYDIMSASEPTRLHDWRTANADHELQVHDIMSANTNTHLKQLVENKTTPKNREGNTLCKKSTYLY
jgi:hypothetical protein